MEKIHEILNYAVGNFTVGKILAAIVAFVVCYLVIHVILKFVNKIFKKTKLDENLIRFIRIALKVLLYFIMAMIVIDTLGVSVTSFVAAFSVVGLTASLAVQDSLSNLAAGIVLLVTKPFKIGDFVQIDDISGSVKVISLIHTRIATADNKLIFVPNSKIVATKVTNYTIEEKRRVDLEISASYDAPIALVRESLFASIKAVGKFLEEPNKPFVAVLSYDDSSIRYVVRAWVKTEEYWPARFALLEQIKTDFDARNIEMTYNHLNVHVLSEEKKEN